MLCWRLLTGLSGISRGEMSTPFSYFDLIEQFEKPGCGVCNLLLRDAARFIDSLLYEYAMDGTAQRSFSAARGFCSQHAWQLMQYKGSVLNITVLYAAALDEILKIIDTTPNTGPAGSRLRRLLGGESLLADQLEAKRPCPVCQSMEEAEKFYLQTMSQYIADARFSAAFNDSDGLCLPHFRQTLRQTTNGENLQRLLAIQAGIWQKLQADLESLKDLFDFNLAGQFSAQEENDSWRRAVRLLAGEKGVNRR